MTAIKNYVNFYEGSYNFKTDETDLNISEDYVLMQLAKQYEYRLTKEDLWAEVYCNGEFKRYIFDNVKGLSEI